MRFVHLHLHTPYSFLDGASAIEEIVRAAADCGMGALAITDHDSVSGAVKFVTCCRAYGIKPLLGAEVTLEDETHLTLIARNRKGYSTLCRLVTEAYAHGGRLTPHLPWTALEADTADLFCLSGCRKGQIASLVLQHRYDEAKKMALRLRDWFGASRLFLELQNDFTPDSYRLCVELTALAQEIGVGVVATNNVHYARPEDAAVHEVLRCVATKTTVAQIHPDRPFNHQRYLKAAAEMERLFDWCPSALQNTVRIAEECEIALPQGEEITPCYKVPEGHDSTSYLRHLVIKGATARYRTLTPKITERLEHELSVICAMGYADYMLMCWDAVRWARRNGIRATGRGSAADSAVAFALFLTDVDVIRRNLPFSRFLVEGKTPDVDIDFPNEDRERVFRYLIDRYGEDKVGAVCTFHTYRSKSAVRDVGKALALPADVLEWFSDHLSHFVRADQIAESFDRLPELKPYAHLKERFELLFRLCARIANFPRHLGSHSSGIVISRVPLSIIAPLQPSARGLMPIWTLDKDDAEAVGAIKFDILSLRTLSAINDAEKDIARTDPRFKYDRISNDDTQTFKMLRASAAVGAFQLESSAQLALAATLQPEVFEDLVASVALIRPGPVRGDAVSRFVACRNGWMSAQFLHRCLVPILAKTFGVILYQEQAIQVIAAMTGCTEAEADRIRKSLAKHARNNTMHEVREEFVRQSLERHADFTAERAHLLFNMLEGWSGYGFTEGHAAAFALTAYRTAYLSVHHAAEYYAGLLNHQPMGFYSANTLAAEARRRGVKVLPLDINRSGDKSYAEEPGMIRLGLRLVTGLRSEDIAAIVTARKDRPFASLLDFCARVSMHRDSIENLILAGAFDVLHPHRRGLLWRLAETLSLALACRADANDRPQLSLRLGEAATIPTPVAWALEDFSPWDAFIWRWRLTGVCVEAHPLTWLRDSLRQQGITTVYEAARQKPGAIVKVAGLNIRPHRPPTRSGRPVLFTTVEDETGLLQVICMDEALAACAPVFLVSPAVEVGGVIERKGKGASLKVEWARPLRMQASASGVAERVIEEKREAVGIGR